MPPRCSVCSHPDRAEIDGALARGTGSLRDIAGRFRLSRSALHRHKNEHLPVRLVKAIEQEETQESIDVYRQLQDVNAAVQSVLKSAQKSGDGDLVLRSADRILRQLELQAKLLGELQDGSVVNVIVSPQWIQLRTVIIGALQSFPDARESVVLALDTIEGNPA
jgi:hypothetical protein